MTFVIISPRHPALFTNYPEITIRFFVKKLMVCCNMNRSRELQGRPFFRSIHNQCYKRASIHFLSGTLVL